MFETDSDETSGSTNPVFPVSPVNPAAAGEFGGKFKLVGAAAAAKGWNGGAEGGGGINPAAEM